MIRSKLFPFACRITTTTTTTTTTTQKTRTKTTTRLETLIFLLVGFLRAEAHGEIQQFTGPRWDGQSPSTANHCQAQQTKLLEDTIDADLQVPSGKLTYLLQINVV